MEFGRHSNQKLTSSVTGSDANPLESIDPKKLIEDALGPVQAELDELSQRIQLMTTASTQTSREIVHHVLSGGGKRIRPALFFMSSKLVDFGDEVHSYNMAAVCEFVHTASLLHDDVIDNSTLRRNKPTSNSIWGDEASVLTGDLIYARASELMAQTGSIEIVSMFARAIKLMSEGELLQLEHLYNESMSESTYFDIINHKTAELLAATCRAPAVLVHSKCEAKQALENFGRYLGFAFQLLDDALDYAGETPVFGKKTLSDLPDGKVTLPVILLRSHAASEEWAQVAKIIRKTDITHKDMLFVLELVNRYDTAGITLMKAETYTLKAIESLEIFPDSENKQNLVRLAKSLLMRLS